MLGRIPGVLAVGAVLLCATRCSLYESVAAIIEVKFRDPATGRIVSSSDQVSFQCKCIANELYVDVNDGNYGTIPFPDVEGECGVGAKTTTVSERRLKVDLRDDANVMAVVEAILRNPDVADLDVDVTTARLTFKGRLSKDGKP